MNLNEEKKPQEHTSKDSSISHEHLGFDQQSEKEPDFTIEDSEKQTEFVIAENIDDLPKRYIDSLGYIYRKKLPIYLNKKGNHVVYYLCSKCNLMQNFIFELKTFKVKEDKVHTCNLTDHLPNKKDSTMNQLDQKEVEELLRLVIFLKYLFFYYLLQGFNANCQTSL